MKNRYKVFKLEILIIGLFILVLSCMLVFNLKDANTYDAYSSNIDKVVEIKCGDGNNWSYATGCFIDKSGTILTNKHVVINSNTNQIYDLIFVRLSNSNEYIEAKSINQCENCDLALISTSIKNKKCFKVSKQFVVGETIYTIGNPNNFGLSLTEGIISAKIKNVIYKESSMQVLQTNLIINEGNSGGPIFNKKGELLGIVSFRLRDSKEEIIQGIAFAVPVNEIVNFLNSK